MTLQNILSQVPLSGVGSSRLAPGTGWKAMGKCEHFVQFYEEDCFLVQSVGDYIATGLNQGEAAIVIATEAHRRALDEHLRLAGLEPGEAEALGRYVSLDAADTLAKFMLDGLPNPRLFNQVFGNLVVRATAGGRPLRAFGEMVALLWQDGKSAAAIRLEELWNELVQRHGFSLFCAYPIAGFSDEGGDKPFTQICKAHTHVIPAEGYLGCVNADDRLRTISLLQQKAASLESEIGHRKEIEKVLARRERELSDFLQNATEGIHQVAPDGKILWANKAELALLGYEAEEYIGQDIRKFHADPEVITEILNRLTRGEELHDFEARLKHKDGSLRYVSINSSVYWEEDRFLYTRCFTRDITGQKRAADILEQTVAQRTAQLRETIGELEAFSYSISHDMRSPLRAMQGYAEALLKDYDRRLDGEAVYLLERIHRAAKRLDLLICDVLTYSKVAQGQFELKPVNLDALVEDILQQHPELRASTKHLFVERPLHTVMGHEAYLTQCLTNLIENGLKFIEPGAVPHVRIHSEMLDGRIRVSVTDNGVGIAPEHYDRIFQIFGRVYPEKRYSGTGIGLAIVKKAVARMRGQTGFESEPGKGSCFWFTLAPFIP